MELSVRTIVVATIVVVVLVTLSFFINIESSEQITRSNANQVFNSLCQSYKNMQCDWAVTREDKFNDFMQACRVLYGNEREAYSCLYTYCQACKTDESADLKCASACEQCRADSSISVRSTCCQQFAASCANSVVKCQDACPAK